jgi:WD40 repeat protein
MAPDAGPVPSRPRFPRLDVLARLSPREDLLAIGSSTGYVLLFSLPDATVRGRADTGTSRIDGVSWFEDQQRFATLSRDGTVRVWSAADAHAVHSIRIAASGTGGQPPRPCFAVVGHDTRCVSIGGPAGAQLHALDTGRLVADLGVGAPRQVTTLAPTPDRTRVAIGDAEGRVGVFAVADGALVAGPWQLPSPIDSLSFSPDGWRLAVGAGDANARVLDVSGVRPAQLFSHEDVNMWGDLRIGHVEFDSSGTRLLASS